MVKCAKCAPFPSFDGCWWNCDVMAAEFVDKFIPFEPVEILKCLKEWFPKNVSGVLRGKLFSIFNFSSRAPRKSDVSCRARVGDLAGFCHLPFASSCLKCPITKKKLLEECFPMLKVNLYMYFVKCGY